MNPNETAQLTNLNILKKLHAIMEECDYIQKDKKNTHQGYNYASDPAIKERLHASLVTHRVLFFFSTRNPRIESNVTWLDCTYRFVDVDTGEQETGTFTGSGQARDDKGHYSAITGAIKYILTSTFLIPTGDDPENDDGATSAKRSYPLKKSAPGKTDSKPAIKNPDDPMSDAQKRMITGLAAEKGVTDKLPEGWETKLNKSKASQLIDKLQNTEAKSAAQATEQSADEDVPVDTSDDEGIPLDQLPWDEEPKQ